MQQQLVDQALYIRELEAELYQRNVERQGAPLLRAVYTYETAVGTLEAVHKIMPLNAKGKAFLREMEKMLQTAKNTLTIFDQIENHVATGYPDPLPSVEGEVDRQVLAINFNEWEDLGTTQEAAFRRRRWFRDALVAAVHKVVAVIVADQPLQRRPISPDTTTPKTSS